MRFLEPPGANLAPKRPPEASGIDFGSHLFIIVRSLFDGLRLCFCVCFPVRFQVVFRLCFFKVPSLFGSARKRRTCEKCNTLQAKTCFSRCALAPVPPGRRIHWNNKQQTNKHSTNLEICRPSHGVTGLRR